MLTLPMPALSEVFQLPNQAFQPLNQALQQLRLRMVSKVGTNTLSRPDFSPLTYEARELSTMSRRS